MTKFLVSALLFGGSVSVFASVDEFALRQSPEALIADQRLVGNVSAQAKREGVVIDVPQLFVYYSDASPAYHLAGYRPTLARELDLVINARRMERSMVTLERLLERAQRPDGSAISVSDLPKADLYLVRYERAACERCERVRETVESWLADRNEQAVRITISLDQ